MVYCRLPGDGAEGLRRREYHRLLVVLLPLTLAGCYDTRLPATLPVAISADRVITADAHSGARPFANSTWQLYALQITDVDGTRQSFPADQGKLILQAHFGAEGEVVACDLFDIEYDGISLKGVLGPTVFSDATIHASQIQGLSYLAETYGGAEGDNVGFTVFAKAFVGPIDVAHARIDFYGVGSFEQARFDDGHMIMTVTQANDIGDDDAPPSGTLTITGYGLRVSQIPQE